MEKTVVVLGKTVTALGTLRALKPLRREGYRIVLATTDTTENIALHSNIPDRKVVFSDGLVTGLLDLAAEFSGKPALLFTRDADIVEVSEQRELLEPHYRFLLPSHEAVETLMEKGRFARFAADKGLSTPATIFVHSKAELLRVPDAIRYPFIVKPYLLHAERVDDEAGLHRLVGRLQALHFHSMIAQEYIEGNDDQLFFVFLLFDQESRLVHSMVGRKLRQWPVSYGTTSLAVTVDNHRLLAEVEQFRQSGDWKGYCSIEYKYDAPTDRYVIMEPTVGRFNQQIALTVASGVNFPVAMVRLLDGEQVSLKPQKNAIRWIYESNDLFSYFRAGNGYGYLRNFFRPRVQVLFSASDPAPLWFELTGLARKKMNKLLQRG
ncbi:MAG: hypothetical protein KDC43_09360 [Saprospiraceae bacterium]|nr:hypothetical protein [Saprospiraceae bacterium]MCB0624099.1 hypothetical protein [Saprospiraceae bacterium]MCB0679832.1 hypothetical protein [Saprospiraceae bacterium]